MGYALAAASGVLLALSFPRYGHPVFAWVALAPLLFALVRTPRPRAFLFGFIAGVIFFAGTLYWITGVMAVYGGLQIWIAVLINAGLILYLSVFTGLFVAITRRFVAVVGPAGVLASPFVWVAAEQARGYVTGFLWTPLGNSQVTVLPIVQLASVTGVFGLSWLAAAVSAALVFASMPLRRRYVPLACALVLIVGIG
ncbi:MAG TPA: hypothetical protein VH497_20370, partial [Vicinamibacterales bacterium]